MTDGRTDTYDRIYAVVMSIPRGRVATYGQVAALADLPRRARLVGYALRHLPPGSDVPWHRVVNVSGGISDRGDAAGERDQRELLLDEGVEFVGPRVRMARYRWDPDGA